MSFELVKVPSGYPGGLVGLAIGCWYLVKQIWDFQVCGWGHEIEEAIH